ncbi:MAG: nuclease A inhibitor family protein [Runella sp.]
MKNKRKKKRMASEENHSDFKTNWKEEVTQRLQKIFYPSESDEPVEWIEIPINVPFPLTISDIRFFWGLLPNAKVEEIPVENFWTPLLAVEEWYEQEQLEQVAQATQLKEILDAHLPQQQSFRVGETEINLYLIGEFDEKTAGGLKTLLVETS